MPPEIIIEGDQIRIDGVHAGCLADCLANYPALAEQIQAAWDAAHPADTEPAA